MKNLININSSNINAFGFTSAFDILAKTLTFDISTLTSFKSGGAANVVGIAFQVTDPSGLPIVVIDWTAPQINPSTQSTFVVNILGGFAMFGWYNIIGAIKDQDGKVYQVNIVKQVCQPEGFVKGGYVPGVFNFIVDCDTPQITINEFTRFVLQGKSALSVTKSGTLTYPSGTLSPLNFTFTPISIGGSGEVLTGRYTVNNNSVATYDLQDGVTEIITYKTLSYEKTVSCSSSLESILCCMLDLTADFNNDPYSATGKAIKTKFDLCSIDLTMAIAKEKSGQDASEEAKRIAKILGCDCDCSSNTIEPKTIITGGTALNNITLIGADAANVSSSIVGNTTQFTIEVKRVAMTNLNDDLAIIINKVETGNSITYALSFNYTEMASAILGAIESDEDLITLLQQIVGATGSNISLDGLDGGCVISLANCNYTLIEATNVVKTIVSIVIGGTVHNAPSNLLLTQTTNIATWLNGLSLGTFVVNYDSGSQTVTISSASNPNIITILNISTTNGPLIRQFSRACIGLVAFLNAVITYICDLQSAQVEFGVTGQSIMAYVKGAGPTVTSIDPTSTLAALLTAMLATEATLFNALNDLGFTCYNVRQMFKINTQAVTDNDGVLGIKNGTCSLVDFNELAGIILNKISTNSTWQNNFCALVANCTAPACPAVTNVSASFASGTLTVNCNDAGSSSAVLVRYRIYNSGGTYTQVSTTSGALPLAITGLVNGVYEVGISKICSSNSIASPWVTAISNNGCVSPVAFTVSVSGSNFVVVATLTSPQTKVNVQMTDPNGGVHNYLNDFGSTSGTFNIAIPSSLYGNYTFIGQAVCDASIVPIYASNFTAPISINVANPTADNIFANGGYGMSLTDIHNGTASGIPSAFNSTVITTRIGAFTSALTAGTVIVVIAGTVPGFTIKISLVLNGSTILDQQTITAAGTYTLTNPAYINGASNQISIEIDS